MTPNSEQWIQHEILRLWGAHGQIRFWRQNVGSAIIGGRMVKFGINGCADILGLIAPTGRFLAIECKGPKGIQRREQRVFERIVTQFGGLYILARSVGDVDSALARIGIYR